MGTLVQVLTREYSEHGVHVANVVIDGNHRLTRARALPMAQKQPDIVMNPVKIAEAFYYLHTQDSRAGHTSFSSHHFRPSRASKRALHFYNLFVAEGVKEGRW